MNNWLFMLIAAVILLLLLFKISLFIEFHFCRRKDDDYVAVSVFALQKIFLYTIRIPTIAVIQHNDLPWIASNIKTPQGDTATHVGGEQRFLKKSIQILFHNPEEFVQLVRSVKQFIRGYNHYISKLAQGIRCEKFELSTIYGFEDAAFTGIMMGVLGSFVNTLLSSAQRRLIFDAKPVILLQPVFGCSQVEIDFRCILRIRFGNVITATMSVLLNSLHGEVTRSG